MPETTLARAFRVPYTGAAAFSIADTHLGCFVGRSEADRPVLLIPLERETARAVRLMGSVRLTFHAQVDFDTTIGRSTGPAAALECMDEDVLPTFCVFARDVATRLSVGSRTRQTVLAAIASWEDLLVAGECLGEERERGLFGELAFLESMPNVPAALAAWQGPDAATLDFTGGSVGVECKTSLRRLRHTISLEQAASSQAHLEIFLASQWVVKDHAVGRTVSEVARALLDQVDDPDALLTGLLQAGWREEHADRYEQRLAVAGRWLFPMAEVPMPSCSDPGVSNIRYDVDLAHRLARALSSVQSEAIGNQLCGLRPNGGQGENDGRRDR